MAVTWVRFLQPERLAGYLTYQPSDCAAAMVRQGRAEYAYPDAERRNPIRDEHFGIACG